MWIKWGSLLCSALWICVCMCRSAHLISRYRPRAPILAVTRNAQTARQAHLYRGIFPVVYTKPANDVWAEDVDMRVNFAMDMGKTWYLTCSKVRRNKLTCSWTRVQLTRNLRWKTTQYLLLSTSVPKRAKQNLRHHIKKSLVEYFIFNFF